MLTFVVFALLPVELSAQQARGGLDSDAKIIDEMLLGRLALLDEQLTMYPGGSRKHAE